MTAAEELEKVPDLDSSRAEVLLELAVSPMRRYFSIITMLLLSVLLINAAFVSLSGSIVTFVTLGAFGLGSVSAAIKMHSATSNLLRLRRDGLHSSDGKILAEISNIDRVERGLFALRPPNGFLIVLKSPMRRAWHPGLWWRLGTRVGVGGMTSKTQGKLLAERLDMLLQDRNRSLDAGVEFPSAS